MSFLEWVWTLTKIILFFVALHYALVVLDHYFPVPKGITLYDHMPYHKEAL
jgi:hypothetical protein